MTSLVTGANRGIGLALARGLAERGERVIGTRRTPAGAPDGAQPAAGTIAWASLDVTRPEDFRRLARDLAGLPVSLLVCNAGIYPEKTAAGAGPDIEAGYGADLWARGLATNVTGVFLTVQALLPNLRAAPAARIAVIASAMGSQARAPGGSYIYRASKAAAINLARNLAVDLRPEGIAVGAYHPGWVRTDMGGSGASLDVETAARGLIARFDALTPERSGCFESHDGRALDL
jgi:NAD(P)-dependent dehydrogenase (short-subunit alcohol dehydrogenase family)